MAFTPHFLLQMVFHGSEYMRTHRNRSRSVSSSAEALESDHASGRDSSVGRAADCQVTGPGFNTHSKPGWALTQPSIPLWVGKMSTSKNIG